ncbi:MFS transporter [Vogesella sp. LIG4]|uniref:MFS transporter n=1 Tax=Vogesella sp. LIG4 TaxID=1192162 RepID=UPI0008202181|nr:MFS transporter [Vogesella sp. LIG4]SCK05863.1 Major Facilitator Superfamily protein [Vogesella sp. LIG4]
MKSEAFLHPQALWRQPVFVGLFASTLLMALGTQIYELALPLIVYELSHSLQAMSSLRAMSFLPNLLLAVFIGVWVDRVCRRRWAQRSLLLMCGLAGGAALALALHRLPVSWFYPLAFGLMLCQYVTAVCRLGLVKQCVPAAQQLAATSYLNTLFNVFAVSGPLLSGMVIALSAPAWGLGLPAMLFMLAACAMLTVPAMPVGRAEGRSFIGELLEGWQALRANQPLWQLAWLVVVANGAAGVSEVCFIFRARDVLGMSSTELGALFACAGAGGVLAGVLMPRLRARLGLGRIIVGCWLLEAVGMLALAQLTSPWLLALSQLGYGFVAVCGNVAIWSYRQESSSAQTIGRVAGLTGSLFKLAMPVSLWLTGVLSHSWPLLELMLAAVALQGLAALGCACSQVRGLR